MAEYIEREALMRNLKKFAPEQLTPLIENLIQKQPAADVADVIMCKDCEHFTDEYECFNDPYCHEYDRYVSKNDYCSRAKDKWKRNKFKETWLDNG